MQIRVFNYNTLEKVHAFEAHTDYIRTLAVHPTQVCHRACFGYDAGRASPFVCTSLADPSFSFFFPLSFPFFSPSPPALPAVRL